MCKTERKERVRESVCVYVCVKQSEMERERDREQLCVHVRVCEGKRERERERKVTLTNLQRWRNIVREP